MVGRSSSRTFKSSGCEKAASLEVDELLRAGGTVGIALSVWLGFSCCVDNADGFSTLWISSSDASIIIAEESESSVADIALDIDSGTELSPADDSVSSPDETVLVDGDGGRPSPRSFFARMPLSNAVVERLITEPAQLSNGVQWSLASPDKRVAALDGCADVKAAWLLAFFRGTGRIARILSSGSR
jgi:hypothetical protein